MSATTGFSLTHIQAFLFSRRSYLDCVRLPWPAQS